MNQLDIKFKMSKIHFAICILSIIIQSDLKISKKRFTL